VSNAWAADPVLLGGKKVISLKRGNKEGNLIRRRISQILPQLRNVTKTLHSLFGSFHWPPKISDRLL